MKSKVQMQRSYSFAEFSIYQNPQDSIIIGVGAATFNGTFLVSKALDLVARSQLCIWIPNFVAINSHITFPAETMWLFSAVLYQGGILKFSSCIYN